MVTKDRALGEDIDQGTTVRWDHGAAPAPVNTRALTRLAPSKRRVVDDTLSWRLRDGGGGEEREEREEDRGRGGGKGERARDATPPTPPPCPPPCRVLQKHPPPLPPPPTRNRYVSTKTCLHRSQFICGSLVCISKHALHSHIAKSVWCRKDFCDRMLPTRRPRSGSRIGTRRCSCSS